MSNLATPIEQLAREYDVVVVGSGYGGAIAASRFARAGRRVCLLERGEERHPGDFPENSAEGLREIQADSPDRRIGSSTALFDLHINPDISVLSGCGLGGTSLINANVAIPPDERVWADPLWPDAIRADVQHGVAQGVRRAQEMLRPTPLPSDQSPPKLQAMEKSAQAMGARFERLPITVNFEDRINHVGVEQPACNSCGNCVGGCNVGAKNTLMMNYLPDARNHGAEIFTCTAVRRVERRGTRWVVHFDLLEAGPKRFNAPGLFVAADVVVLAAGSLGSTEILLRSRESGLPVSDRLGEGFTGNGDVLGFAYNADQFIGGVGVGSTRGKKGPGPCITSVIDLRGTDRLNDGMIIEEGVIPSTLGPILAPALLMASRAVGEDTDAGLRDYAEEKYREIQALVPGGSTGAVGNTQTFLVMAHDDSAGRIHLADDRVRIAWPGVGSQAVFDKINGELLRATAALGGTYVTNPLWTKFAGKSLVTVHPLGGCGMGETSETGVVDHRGRVFSGESGDQVHDGLYVSDGSVIPRSLGVNPLLTISALAERTADLIARDRGWEIPYDLPSAPRAASVEKRVGVQFTEAMRGFFSLGSDLDFAEAAEQGKESDSPLEFTLTVNSDDLYDMLRRPDHSASLYGSVSVPALSTEPFSVTKGTFHLLTVDPDEVRTRRMTYKMPMEHPDGRTFFLHGFKRIHDDRGFDVWSDTTTLFVSVHEGEDESGPVVGRGVLRIKTKDFSKQLRTFKITNAGGIARRLKAMADFGKFFAGALYDTYGGVLAPRSTLDPGATARTRRELVVDPPDAHYFSTADGVSLRLVRYEGGSKGPVLLVHGLGMSGQVFAVDTVDVNLVEYLAASGYDVWVLDSRASIDIAGSEDQFTADLIAEQDLPAAVGKVRELTGAAAVDVVAHGLGATTLLMAIVGGLQGVRSAVCSQGGLHVVTQRAARVKAGLYLPGVIKALGQQSLRADGGGTKGWKNRLFDVGLRLLPVELEERCSSPVCRRITFMYGPLYEHDQINLATHEALHELFGVVNLQVFDHLARMVREGHAVRATGGSWLRDLDRLALPITFLHGADNACFLPESTQATMAALADANGPDFYHHTVIPDYGDMDCLIGKDAARDVFPLILEHLERQTSS
ncbi:MAG: GMC oxidoreductase [Longimicrobiales bacterium]|nr:GMC oxidoreductase [Longimicrobiales bacterium]